MRTILGTIMFFSGISQLNSLVQNSNLLLEYFQILSELTEV
jgi:hypothetical protein